MTTLGVYRTKTRLRKRSFFSCMSVFLVCAAMVALQPQRNASLAAPTSANPPILLIVNSAASNKFGLYLGEILRAEGLNAFDLTELSALSAGQLAQYDLAILADTTLNSTQVDLLTSYVSSGGALLAMKPDAQIASLFGLNGGSGALTDGYLGIQTSASFNGGAPGAGLTPATLQIHGDADLYTTNPGAVTIAQLYSDATTITTHPAVVAANHGGGQAAAFTYDLASNVAYTRQGNPANANINADEYLNDWYVRTVDLFQTVGGGAPWVDRDKIPIPQADEQQRLFARIVQQLVSRNHPLPQLWYFPGTAKTMLILTSDAHWNDAANDFPQFIADLNARQGQVTMYLGPDGVWPDNATLQTWQAQGHTFGIHPYRVDGSTLTAGVNSIDSLFASTYTIPRSNTVRIHRYEWQGWTDAADVAAAHGIALDVSFAGWGAWLQKPDGTWPHGYMTGSGLPMKFIRSDGTLTPVYQQLTNLTDDQLLPAQAGPEGLTGSQAVAVSQALLDASLAGNYSAQTELHHVDYYASTPSLQMWLTGVTVYACSKGVPVWNADRWLSFTQTRHDANFSNIAWNAGVLSFNLSSAATGNTLSTMLPLAYGGQPLQSVTVDGSPATFSTQTIKGTNVAFVGMAAGNHAVSATYGGPTPTPSDTPTVTPTPVCPPAAPVIAISYSAPAVNLEWQHNSVNVSYEVWRNAQPYFDPANPPVGVFPIATVPAPLSGSTVTYPDANAGQSDFYMVRGVNAASTPSAPSNFVGIFRNALVPGSQ